MDSVYGHSHFIHSDILMFLDRVIDEGIGRFVPEWRLVHDANPDSGVKFSQPHPDGRGPALDFEVKMSLISLVGTRIVERLVLAGNGNSALFLATNAQNYMACALHATQICDNLAAKVREHIKKNESNVVPFKPH